MIGKPIFKQKNVLDKSFQKIKHTVYSKSYWSKLSSNPNAIPLLERNLDLIDWVELSKNPNAIHILEKNLEKIQWSNLSENPNALHLLEKHLEKKSSIPYGIFTNTNPKVFPLIEKLVGGLDNLDKRDFRHLSQNPNAIHILSDKLHMVNWTELSLNPSAIYILEDASDCINWLNLSKNPNAIPLLEKNLNKVYWPNLSKNPNAISILEKNLDKISWNWLSANPNAIHIIENNLHRVDFTYLAANPNALHLLYDLDCEMMKEQNREFYIELNKVVLNPERIERMTSKYNIEFFEYLRTIMDGYDPEDE